MTAIKKIWDIFTTTIVAVLVILAILLAGGRLFGFQIFTVISGSMEPLYQTGSLIYVKAVDDPKAIPDGTVITYMMDEDTVVTHRVVGTVPDDEDPTVIRYRTKGDANDVEDGMLVHYKNIIGSPVFSIPKLGYVSAFIQEPPGTYLSISIGATLLLVLFLPELVSTFSGSEEKNPKKNKGGAHCKK